MCRNSAISSAIAPFALTPAMSDDEFEIRPGRIKDRGTRSAKPKSLVAQVRALSNKAGRVGIGGRSRRGTGRNARGRSAALRMHNRSSGRRVLVKARVVRHTGSRFTAAPLARHIAYLKRDGVTRDGRDADLFGAGDEAVDGEAFAERCAEDRHHFRFIVSPEDAIEMGDVRAFTHELMTDMSADLGTRLDWVAVDHWNTDNPHIHILVRGKADDSRDLVIDKDYIREGMRGRAEQLVTLELGPRTEREIDRAMAREVSADRWTSLDRRLQSIADRHGGVIDLRADAGGRQTPMTNHLLGRATKLERLGLATLVTPGCWLLKPNLEPTLRDMGTRGDIIKTMHQALGQSARAADVGRFALHPDGVDDPVIGRLVARGLQDELSGSAYAIIDGIDGRVHHIRFADLEATGDALPGAIVELRGWTGRKGQPGHWLWVQSDLPIAKQIHAHGSTWLDRQLIASEPLQSGGRFGNEVDQAKCARAEHLVQQGLASKQVDHIVVARNLLGTLRSRELAEVAAAITERTGLPHRPATDGGTVSGTYRERLQLASGRFAMIDDGLGFELVPWKPSLDRHLGEQIMGTIKSGGGIEWSLGRSRGIAL
jgi:type IV secretory pathway VirD2 relaxase